MRFKYTLYFTLLCAISLVPLHSQVVYWSPEVPLPGDTVRIFYDVINGTLPDNTDPVYIHIGYNGWNPFLGDFAMQSEGNGWWSYLFNIPLNAEVIDFVFTDLQGNWDNNGGYGIDYHIPLNYYWNPYRPTPNDSLRVILRNCTQGGELLWQIKSNGYFVIPLPDYRPPNSTESNDGLTVVTPLSGPDQEGNCEVIFPPFNNLRQLVETLRIRIRWNDGTEETSAFEVFPDYTPQSGDPEILFVAPSPGDTISENTGISLISRNSSSTEVWAGYDSLGTFQDSTLQIQWTPSGNNFAYLTIRAKALNDSGRVTIAYQRVYALPQINHQPVPPGINDGVTIQNGQVTFALYAPFKQFVALKGSFNVQFPAGELMNLSGDTLWWLSKTLAPGRYYYQYNLEGIKLLADPWSRDVEWKISGTDYESWDYSEARTVFEVGQEEYSWNDDDFVRPAREDLIIYELHVGDFAGRADGSGTYQDILLKLEEGYFDSLGINAVEFMPLNEFEGAYSWGYNPSFYLAPESSYGTPRDLKELIDRFHQHGIAVLIDVVFNHMWGTAPLFQLYQPLNNWNWQDHDFQHCPYFQNQQSEWGYKLEHWHGTTPAGLPRRTWKYVTDCLKMWVNEYHADGFRFDYTSGIGWDYSGANGMNFYASFLRNLDSTLILIAEEDNSYAVNHSDINACWNFSYYHMTKANLQEISDAGFNWGSMYQVSREIKASTQGFEETTGPVNYCESHDETRIIYEGMHYQGFTREKAIKKSLLGATLLFTSQGIPMIYHGQEFGQDGNSRSEEGYILPQPLKWNYLQLYPQIFKHYQRLIWLRKNRTSLKSGTLTPKLINSTLKCIAYWREAGEEKEVILLNFAREGRYVALEFPETGTWYEFVNDDTLLVEETTLDSFYIEASSGLIFCNYKDWESLNSIREEPEPPNPKSLLLKEPFPNPFNSQIIFVLDRPYDENVTLRIFTLQGKLVTTLTGRNSSQNGYIIWDGLDQQGQPVPSGVYLAQIEADGVGAVRKIVYLK